MVHRSVGTGQLGHKEIGERTKKTGQNRTVWIGLFGTGQFGQDNRA
jgi:hypothetical protein